MQYLDKVLAVLSEALPGCSTDDWDESTPLLGVIPEFDSMTVLSVITMIEEQLEITVDDEDIMAEDFETVGTLVSWVAAALR